MVFSTRIQQFGFTYTYTLLCHFLFFYCDFFKLYQLIRKNYFNYLKKTIANLNAYMHGVY